MTDITQIRYFNTTPEYLLLRRLYRTNALVWTAIEPLQRLVNAYAEHNEQLEALLNVAQAWSDDLVALELIWELHQVAPQRVDEERLGRACGNQPERLLATKRFLKVSEELELTAADFRILDDVRDQLSEGLPFRELAQLLRQLDLTEEQLGGIQMVFDQVTGDDIASDLFRGFMVDIALDHPNELAYFKDYEPPSGKLEHTEVVHILEWPPSNKTDSIGPLSPVFKDDKNATIEFVKGSFPGWKKHFAFDMFPKRLPYPEAGERHDIHAILREQTILVKCFQLFEQYVLHLGGKPQSGKGPIIIIHSSWVRSIFEKSLGCGTELTIGDCKHTIYKMNHPAFLRRYAGIDTLSIHIELYQEIHHAHDLTADTAKLRLWKNNRTIQNDDSPALEDFPYERRDSDKLENGDGQHVHLREPSQLTEQIELWQKTSIVAIAGLQTVACGSSDLLRTVSARPRRVRSDNKRSHDQANNDDARSKKVRDTNAIGRRYGKFSYVKRALRVKCDCLQRLKHDKANVGVLGHGPAIRSLMMAAHEVRQCIYDIDVEAGGPHRHALALRYSMTSGRCLFHLTSSKVMLLLGGVPEANQDKMTIYQVASQLIAGIESPKTLSLGSIPMAQYGPFKIDRNDARQIEIETQQARSGMELEHEHWLPMVGVELHPSLRKRLRADLEMHGYSTSCRTSGLLRHIVFALYEGIGLLTGSPSLKCMALTPDGQWTRKTHEGESVISRQDFRCALDIDEDQLEAQLPGADNSSKSTSNTEASASSIASTTKYRRTRFIARDLRLDIGASMNLSDPSHSWLPARMELITNKKPPSTLLTIGRALSPSEMHAKAGPVMHEVKAIDVLVSFIRHADSGGLVKTFETRDPPIAPIEKVVKFGLPVGSLTLKSERDVRTALRDNHYLKRCETAKYAITESTCKNQFDRAVSANGILPMYWVKFDGKVHFMLFVALREGRYGFTQPAIYAVYQAKALLASDPGITEVKLLADKTWCLDRGGEVEYFRFTDSGAREDAIVSTMLYTVSDEEQDRRRAVKQSRKLAALVEANKMEREESHP